MPAPHFEHIGCEVCQLESATACRANPISSGESAAPISRNESKSSESAKNAIITKTLDEIIGTTKYKDHKIDLLSIDAENHDYYVLNSLSWRKYNPKWVIVESWETDIHKILKSKINKFMEDKGYLIVSWTVKSLIYAKK